MKRHSLLTALVLAALSTIAAAQARDSKPSPAEIGIQRAEALIAKNPTDSHGYNELAMAYARRAREISDVSFYSKAEEALAQSLKLKPNNYEGMKAKTWMLLGRHEFAKALDLAEQLRKQNPDDVTVYGYLTDANVELGNYKAAEESAQWMLDLRPGNIPALTRAAYLRELFGDPEGSAELMRMAYDSTPDQEREDRAWIVTQLAHLELIQGHTDRAESLLNQALALFPNYHYALGNLGRVRMAQKRYDDAVKLFRQRYDNAPHAENLFEVGVALRLSGKNEEANRTFAEFEQKSLAESHLGDNSNHELATYYADYAHRPADALRIAQVEFSRRQDVNTRDLYAWSLYLNGRVEEAHKQMSMVMDVGVREARFLNHAAEIAARAGLPTESEKYARLSKELQAR